MIYKVRLREEADQDLALAASWYEQQKIKDLDTSILMKHFLRSG
ncbi:MAG: hypothetical protein ACKVHQ_14385 [Gammaproteobacteria bacterium]|jgi:hypothetical protein